MTEAASADRLALVIVRVTLGSLFVTQFFANVHDGNFRTAGYRRLVGGYIARADAPGWWKSFERFAVDHAQVFALLQAAGEISLGVALVAGILRLEAGLGSAALLAMLWLSELGIYWTWELVPVIAIALAVTVGAWGDRRSSRRRHVAGPVVLGPRARIVAPVAIAALVVTAVLANRDPAVEAWRAAVVVAAASAVSAVLDARVREAA